MPRYIVERSLPDDLQLPASEARCESSLDVAVGNAEDGVTWLHSYITTDARRMFCVYDASGPEAIR